MPVIGHIAGASGSGKTTLLNNMKSKHPSLVTLDLDEHDDQAEVKLFKGKKKKKDFTKEDFKSLANERQRLLDVFLKQHNKELILLAGHHTEGEHILDLPNVAPRWLLNVSASKSAYRAYRRDNTRRDNTRHAHEIFSDIAEAKEVIAQLKYLGYQLKTAKQIEDIVDSHF